MRSERRENPTLHSPYPPSAVGKRRDFGRLVSEQSRARVHAAPPVKHTLGR